VERETTPEEGYHFTDDMTDRAIGWIRQQKALMPDKPFFVYYSPGGTHAPHHVPTEWSDKYKGRFDAGWDALREEILVPQKELGVVPADTELTARHDEIPAWDKMPEELRPVLARRYLCIGGGHGDVPRRRSVTSRPQSDSSERYGTTASPTPSPSAVDGRVDTPPPSTRTPE
jgi:hypothetical protein